MMRLELFKKDAQNIRIPYGWKTHCSGMYGAAYFDQVFADSRNNVYTHCNTRLMRFLVTDYVQLDLDCGVRGFGGPCGEPMRGSCLAVGTCTFLGKYHNTHVRIIAWETSPVGAHGVQVYFFSPRNEIIGMAFMYVQQGKAPYEYHPLINEIPREACPSQYIQDIFATTKRLNASWLIQKTLLKTSLDPAYDMCRRRLIREFALDFTSLL